MRLLPGLLALFYPVLSFAAAAPAPAPTADAAKGVPATPDVANPVKTVKLLTVGNSFSQNATHYLGQIAAAAKCKLVMHWANVGGSPLELHWKKAEDFERDPNEKNGYYGTHLSLHQELEKEQWDFITIQQYSMYSHNVETYRPFAKNLYDYIKKYDPTAEVLMHETWPYRVDDPRFSAKDPKSGEPKTQAEMYSMLTSAYRTIAQELGVRILPVGDAFNMANNDPAWGFKAIPKPTGLVEPALPDQTHSLNRGYYWNKDTKTGKPAGLVMDGHHASTAGEYLGACIWFEVMFKMSCVGNTFRPPGLSDEDAKYLQETAHRAVEAEAAREAKKG